MKRNKLKPPKIKCLHAERKTQVQVAKEIGISEVGYKSHERGTQIPNVITAIKIDKVLGTTSEKLRGYSANGRM